jgi:methyl-accepting chemotaxis protein
MILLGGFALWQQWQSANSQVEGLRTQLYSDFDVSAKREVETVLSLLRGIYDEHKSGKMSIDEAKTRSANLLRVLRYDGSNYFWVDTVDGLNIVLPGNPKEGQQRLDSTDSKGFHNVQAFIEKAKAGGGYTNYWWSRKGTEGSVPKRSYTALFEPFGWVVGTGNYVDDIEKTLIQREVTLMKAVQQRAIFFALITLLGIVIAVVVGFKVGRSIGAPIEHTIDALKKQSTQALNRAAQAANSSRDLKESSLRQLSAIQETSASMEEMRAMIEKTLQNSKDSSQLAKISTDAAQNGKDTSSQISGAMSELNQGNREILKEFESSNQRIGEIIELISEISQKTKVINDIVFQTKLLSFNASVEAARAGEQGKGFAVVAEEVGNLAQTSGKQAREINGLLESSTHKVESILNETRAQMNGLLDMSKSRLERTSDVANQSLQVFDKIALNVEKVQDRVEQISHAMSEQSLGANEISTAIQELNEISHRNGSLSTELSQAAEDSSTQAHELEKLCDRLSELVWGNRTAA